MPQLSTSAAILGVLLLSGSVLVWCVLIYRAATHRTPAAPIGSRPQLPSIASLFLVVLWTALNLVTHWISSKPVPSATREVTVETVQATSLMHLVLGAMVLVPLLLESRAKSSDFGFGRRHLVRDGLIGIAGYFMAIGPVAIVWWLSLPLRNPEGHHPLLKLLGREPQWDVLIWVVFSAAVVAPLVEELLYRVVLQSGLRQVLRPAPAILLSSVIFAALHGWPDALPLLPLALVFGTLYEKFRSYWVIVVVHVLFNATNILMLWLSL